MAAQPALTWLAAAWLKLLRRRRYEAETRDRPQYLVDASGWNPRGVGPAP